MPSNLPKVTRAKNGKPSIDMNGQGAVDSLVSQTLVKGTGKEVTDKNTVVVKLHRLADRWHPVRLLLG